MSNDEEDGAVIAHSVDDPDRFAMIWERYAGDVHRFVMRRLGRDLADDVTAETFAIALRQRRRRARPARRARCRAGGTAPRPAVHLRRGDPGGP